MGFLGSIGKVFKKIGSGIVKFAKSPFGKLLMNVGLGLLTGGMGNLLSSGLSMLGGGGNLLSTFTGFASKFLGPAQSMLSGSGLGSLSGFLGNAGSSGDLFSMAKSLVSAQNQQPKTDATTQQVVQSNLAQLFAYQQAQLLRASA